MWLQQAGLDGVGMILHVDVLRATKTALSDRVGF